MSGRDPSTWALPSLEHGSLVSEFDAVSLERWRATVDAERAGTVSRLGRRDENGIAIAPLYTGETANKTVVVPAGPGATLVGRLHETGDPDGLAAAIAAEAPTGVQCAWIRMSASQRAGWGVARGRGIEIPPTSVAAISNAGASVFEAGHCAGAVLRRLPETHAVTGVLSDPFATLAETGGYAVGLDEALAQLVRDAAWAATHQPAVAVALASGATYHDAGATDALEIGMAIATGLAVLEALIAGGIDPGKASAQLQLLLAVDHVPQAAIAKLRATRLLWTHALSHMGAGGPAPRIWVRSSIRARTRDDAANNLLRATLESFAAMLGGADGALIAGNPTVMPNDAPDSEAGRLARQTMLVLRDEAGLGRVNDPGAGSWALEARTNALAEVAWRTVQQITEQGGPEAALRGGWLHAQIGAASDARRAKVARQQSPLTGATIFAAAVPESAAESGEPAGQAPPVGAGDGPEPAVVVAPMLPQRLSAPFEALADRGRVLQAAGKLALVPLGSVGPARPQLDFAADVLRVAGLPAPAPTEPGAALDSIAVAVLCGGADAISEHAAVTATRAKAQGVAWVVVAGRPGSPELAATLSAAGVDEVVHRGCDLLGALQRVHAALKIGASR